MLQDIHPHRFDCAFHHRNAQNGDYVLPFDEEQVLLNCTKDTPAFLRYEEFCAVYNTPDTALIYLFSIDDSAFFLTDGKTLTGSDRYCKKDAGFFRTMEPAWISFAGITATQLARWYRQHAFCGHCGNSMQPAQGERMLACTLCGQVEYPKISPAIIVGIIHGDYILMSKYAGGGYRKYALIAGFMEIGETLEDTLRREVMEEVGLTVKNIRYYSSQPWALSDSLLVGFFADLDGSDEIHLDERELSEAVWMHRKDIPCDESTMSLTRTMMEAFRTGEISATAE